MRLPSKKARISWGEVTAVAIGESQPSELRSHSNTMEHKQNANLLFESLNFLTIAGLYCINRWRAQHRSRTA
jgi:hypothetical protein